jgi:hypothetical protein
MVRVEDASFSFPSDHDTGIGEGIEMAANRLDVSQPALTAHGCFSVVEAHKDVDAASLDFDLIRLYLV